MHQKSLDITVLKIVGLLDLADMVHFMRMAVVVALTVLIGIICLPIITVELELKTVNI